jgi:hypothetical protein
MERGYMGIENPRVGGSIPSPATIASPKPRNVAAFLLATSEESNPRGSIVRRFLAMRPAMAFLLPLDRRSNRPRTDTHSANNALIRLTN